MTTQQHSEYDPQKDSDDTTRIYMEHQRVHLAKLSGPSLQPLINKWINTFFERQEIFADKDEFHIELETVIEEYTGYFESSGDNILRKETRERMKQIAQLYHELFYDGEIDPYSEIKQETLVKQVGARGKAIQLLGWVRGK